MPAPEIGSRTETPVLAPLRRWRPTWLVWVTVLCGLAGATIIAYPTTAAWFAQYNQSSLVHDYNESIKSLSPAAKDQLQSAHEYNQALSSGAIVGANENVPTGNGSSANQTLDYYKLLVSPNKIMARLRIPSIKLDLPIYHGTSEETLLEGLGHLEGTSLPVGGSSTHSVITGHRGLASAVMFTNLDKVTEGDTFTLEVLGEVLTYRVFSKKVVAPEDTETLRQIPGADHVTLITCTPLGVNTHRILVTAERITPTPIKDIEAAKAPPAGPGFPWWAVLYTLALGLIGLYLWKAGYQKVKSVSGSSQDENDVESEEFGAYVEYVTPASNGKHSAENRSSSPTASREASDTQMK